MIMNNCDCIPLHVYMYIYRLFTSIEILSGERMIILHAGFEAGFVPGAELVFKARSQQAIIIMR